MSSTARWSTDRVRGGADFSGRGENGGARRLVPRRQPRPRPNSGRSAPRSRPAPLDQCCGTLEPDPRHHRADDRRRRADRSARRAVSRARSTCSLPTTACMPRRTRRWRGLSAALFNPPPSNFQAPSSCAARRRQLLQHHHRRQGHLAMPAWGDGLLAAGSLGPGQLLYTIEPARRLAEGQASMSPTALAATARPATARPVQRHAAQARTAARAVPAALARKTDDELFDAIAHGSSEFSDAGYSARLSQQEMWAAVSYCRAAVPGWPRRAAVAGDDPARRAASPGCCVCSATIPQGGGCRAPRSMSRASQDPHLARPAAAAAPRRTGALAAQDATAAARWRAAGADRRRDRCQTARADVAALAGPLAQSLEAQFAAPAGAGQPSERDQLVETRRLLDQALAMYRDCNARGIYIVSGRVTSSSNPLRRSWRSAMPPGAAHRGALCRAAA